MSCQLYGFIIVSRTPFLFFFFNDTATTEIYTLSLHDALPIFYPIWRAPYMTINADTYVHDMLAVCGGRNVFGDRPDRYPRSEEHTSELQSQSNLVCRLLLEKKKAIQCVGISHSFRAHPHLSVA